MRFLGNVLDIFRPRGTRDSSKHRAQTGQGSENGAAAGLGEDRARISRDRNMRRAWRVTELLVDSCGER